MLKHHQPKYLLGLTMVALLLRSFRLGFRSIWLDEAYSIKLANNNLLDIIRGASQDIHPPLFHILLGPWLKIWGNSEIALRSFSVFWGVLLIPLAYKLVKKTINARAAWYVAILITFSPYLVELSRMGRMPSLLVFLNLLSWYYLWQFLDTRKLSYAIIYTIACLASLYTHYFTFLFLLAQYTFIILNFKMIEKKTRKICWLLPGVIFLGYLPWLKYCWQHIEKGGPAWRGLGTNWWESIHSLYAFIVGTACWSFFNKILVCSIIILAGIFWLVFFIKAKMPFNTLLSSSAAKMLISLLVVPLLIVGIYSIFKLNIFDNRYLSLSAISLLILIGVFISRLAFKKSIIIMSLFLIAFSIPLFNQFFVYGYYDNWRSAAKIIKQEFKAEDEIAIYPAWNQAPLEYYLKNEFELKGLPGNYDPISGITQNYFYIDQQSVSKLEFILPKQNLGLVLVNEGKSQVAIQSWCEKNYAIKKSVQIGGIRILVLNSKKL